ncbi:MAG TPA: hypothetical protein VKN36_10310 [Eudoraea sp.]|nr:hypothetical protein [Eudoraea sp.]
MEIVNQGRIPQPTISGSYGYAWQQLWKYFLSFFIIGLLVAIFEGPASIARDSEMNETAVSIFVRIVAAAYMLLVFPVINYGGDLLYLRGIRDEKMEIGLLFDGFRRNYLNIVLSSLLTFAIIGLGFLFLIVPGIIFACRLAFVSFLVMDKNMEPIAAIEKSWEMTRGYGWKIFGMALLAIPVFFAGLLCFIVGVIIAVMWIAASFAAMYHAIDLEDQKRLTSE